MYQLTYVLVATLASLFTNQGDAKSPTVVSGIGGLLGNVYTLAHESFTLPFAYDVHSDAYARQSDVSSDSPKEVYYKVTAVRRISEPGRVDLSIKIVAQHCSFLNPNTTYSKKFGSSGKVHCERPVPSSKDDFSTPIRERLSIATIKVNEGQVQTRHMFPVTDAGKWNTIWTFKSALSYDEPLLPTHFNVTVDIRTLVFSDKALPASLKWKTFPDLSFKVSRKAPHPGDLKFVFDSKWAKVSQRIMHKPEMIAHKAVLMQQSNYFSALFERFPPEPTAAVHEHRVISDFSLDTIQEMLSFMYYGTISASAMRSVDQLSKLYKAALYYQVEWLELFSMTHYIRLHMKEAGAKSLPTHIQPQNTFDEFALMAQQGLNAAKGEVQMQADYLKRREPGPLGD
jgi:hypothetical protein